MGEQTFTVMGHKDRKKTVLPKLLTLGRLYMWLQTKASWEHLHVLSKFLAAMDGELWFLKAAA